MTFLCFIGISAIWVLGILKLRRERLLALNRKENLSFFSPDRRTYLPPMNASETQNKDMSYKPTHFIYLSGPNGMVEPTGMMNLSFWNVYRRRGLIHNLMLNGELLAKIPDGLSITTMHDLREYLSTNGNSNEDLDKG
jgi:hypothetical protein